MAVQTILPADVAAKYEYTFSGWILRTELGEIDFRKLTLEQADKLASIGFRHLVKRREQEQQPEKQKRKFSRK